MTPAATVVRIPYNGRDQTVGRVLAAVAGDDLDLSDRLHAPVTTASVTYRPYSVVRRVSALDVCCLDDEIAKAVIRGCEGARLVRRVRAEELLGPGCEGPTLRLAFETPTAFRVNGFDHLIPDATHVFRVLLDRWRALGWPELPDPVLTRVPCWPEVLTFSTIEKARQTRRGFVGSVRYEVVGQRDEGRAALWTLARFGEYAGVGQGTTYGMGRVRILRDGDRWSKGARQAAWDRPT